jgi:hypothetical protein
MRGGAEGREYAASLTRARPKTPQAYLNSMSRSLRERAHKNHAYAHKNHAYAHKNHAYAHKNHAYAVDMVFCAAAVETL